MYIGKTPTVGNFQVCDAISVVNGQAAYTLQVGGTNVAPESANHMLVSLNGILQKPGSSFTISGSTMTFASNLATGDVIDFVQILGNVLDLGVPSDGTVTSAKITYPLTTFSSTGIDDNATSTAITIDSSGNITQPLQPSFRVQPTSEQTNISVDAWNTIAFGTEAVDTGSNFASNTFTAPVTGTYALSGAMYLQSLDSAASSYQVQIHTSNDSYSILVIVPAQLLSADTQYYAFAGAVFADMDANDTAILRIYQEGGTAQTDINVSSVFTGHLLG
jgi:hypothetical protein